MNVVKIIGERETSREKSGVVGNMGKNLEIALEYTEKMWCKIRYLHYIKTLMAIVAAVSVNICGVR